MIIKKIKENTLRRAIRNKLADILEDINESATIDEIETELIAMGIKYALDYYDVKKVPNGVGDVVAEEVVKCLGKLNMKLQTRLRK